MLFDNCFHVILCERKLHDCKLYEMELHCCFMVNKNRYERYQMGSSGTGVIIK